MRDERHRTGDPEDLFAMNATPFGLAPGKQVLSEGLSSHTYPQSSKEEAGSSGSLVPRRGRFAEEILGKEDPSIRAGDWHADDALMSALGLGGETHTTGDPQRAGVPPEFQRIGAATGPGRASPLAASPHPSARPSPSAGPSPTGGGLGPHRPPPAVASTSADAAGYRPPWDQIARAAASDAAAIAALDIEWIDTLDKRFLDQIDSHFSAANETKAFQELLENDPRVKAARKSFERESTKAKTEAASRVRASGVRNQREAYRQDPTYRSELSDLQATQDRDVSEVKQELRPPFDAQQQPFELGDTVVEPPADGVTWKEGRTLTRVNFVAWGLDIFGSVEAFKAHFLGMRPISGTTGLWMCASAATRYEHARAWFEGQYPGNTFFSTSVGQSMRGLHQHESPLGYLGHALGLSVDFAAYENPNQDDPAAQFLLRTFGGTKDAAGARIQGDNNLDMPAGNATAKIRAMGSASVASEELPAGSDQYLEQVGTAFDEMAATSDRFQESLRADLPSLRTAKQTWVTEAGPRNAALASTEKKLAVARKVAQKKLQRATRDAVTAEMVDQDESVAGLLQKCDEQKADLQPYLDSVLSTMKTVFAPWIDEFQSDVDRRERLSSEEDRAVAISPQDADAALEKVKAARSQRELTALLTNRRFRAVFATIDPATLVSQQELKEAMRTRADQVRKARWDAGEIATRLELIRRLSSDPRAVFGSPKAVKHKGGAISWAAPDTVRQPSVMQYLEKGFVKHDDLAAASDAGRKKGVFNREFVTAMMRWGFSTGASWDKADTMHFDFEDGYGMIQGNRGTKFGPKG